MGKGQSIVSQSAGEVECPDEDDLPESRKRRHPCKVSLGLQQEVWITSLSSWICNIRCPVLHVTISDGVTCLTWLGVSRYLATGCADGKVRLWDSLSGDCVRTFNGHSEPIQSLSISANKDFLVSVSTDGTARVFEIEEYKQAIYPS